MVSTPADREQSPHRTWLVAVALVVLAFAAYQPVWQAGFIWDDDDHLTQNPAMTAPHGLRMIWSSLSVSRYYPLTLTTFWVERRLWGLSPMPYHMVNVALHAINGFLVYLLLRRLRVPAAWFAAGLWVLHPVNVESVAWVTELKNTQSGIFFFLALLFFLRFDADGKRPWYWLAVLSGLAAMLSKPSTVVLPLSMLLCVWWNRRHLRRVDAVRVAPFFAFALLLSVTAIVEQHGQIVREGTADWSLTAADRLVIAGKALWFYAGRLVWPEQLTFVYPRWAAANSLWSWLPLAGVLGVAVILWWRRERGWARAGIFGLGYFATALLPVLGIFNVYYFRYSFVADHFQYLASAGFIALVSAAGAKIYGRTGRLGERVGMVAGLVVLALAGVLTWSHAGTFRDVETLWRDTLARNPSAWIARNNLGILLQNTGRSAEAETQFERVLRIKPDDPQAHNNLGIMLVRAGRVEEGIAHIEQAVQVNPGYAEAYYNLGLAWARAGNLEDAIRNYERALQIDPDSAETHDHLAEALAQTGHVPAAIPHWERALQLNPGLAEAHNNLGIALMHAGNAQEAMRHLEQAVRINPDYPTACHNLARLQATLPPAQGGDPVRAVSLARHACELTGYQSPAFVDTLAQAYAATGQFEDAVAAAQKAVELARAAGQPGLAEKIEARLQFYRDGHADRETGAAGDSPNH
ncbi:MAG TPA: tetratricopeptide repeat protein [Verrucomicrobiae bacterium]|nr:tetratricopeptide repeat protein [Verrucomicrobiae bacterium]